MEGSNRGATVTPIRPEVQIADTTPFGASPPEPTAPTPVDDGTWGVSPRRRMCIQEPAEPTAADAEPPTNTDTLTSSAGTPEHLAANTYTREQLDENHPYTHRAPIRARSLWRSVTPVALLAAVLGAAFAVFSVSVSRPSASSSRNASPNAQASAILSSLPAWRASTDHHSEKVAGHRLAHHPRAHRAARRPVMHHASPNTTPSEASSPRSTTTASGTATPPPAIPVYPAPAPTPTPSPVSNPAPSHSSTTTHSSTSTHRPIIGQNGTLAPGGSPDS